MRLSPIPIIAVLLLLVPSVALGQEPGVTVDDGPSSKEYAIPLDSARGQAKTKAPTAKTAPPASAATPTGTPATTTTTKSGERSAPDAETPQADDESTLAVPTTPPAPPANGTPVSTRNTSSNGMSPGVAIVGLAIALLVLGGIAGLVIRRRGTPIGGQ